MEEIKLKPEKKKKKSFLKKLRILFEDKKKRYLYMLLFMLPFVVAIGIFGFITYKEAKSLLSLATGDTEIKVDYQISSMNYVLRDNATDVQIEYFNELKDAIENNVGSDAEAAGLVCKNFVADFYTWSNKQGQYDVGGLYYIYSGKNEADNYKNQLYLQARDGFYKYLNNYISEYGSANLLEVETVEVVKAQECKDAYQVYERTGWIAIDEDTNEEVYEFVDYEAYEVTCSWAYKQNDKFDTSKYPKKGNFVVILRDGRFEIVEASE